MNILHAGFWTMATAVMAGFTALIAWRQLRNLSQTGKAEFWHKFKTDFFTTESITLISLVEYDLLVFHNIEIPTFSVKKNTIVSNDTKYTTTAVDNLLLGHFEDLGLFEKKGIVSIDMIYETFSEYIERSWENEVIQQYITVTADGDYSDTYSNFRYIYEKCIIYGQTIRANNNRSIIYIPGLHDTSLFNKLLVSFVSSLWQHFGFTFHVIYPHWKEGETFTPKLQLITQAIDKLTLQGNTVILIGQSAGGSAVLNAFVERKEKVAKIISICGRLRTGENVFPSLNVASKGNPAFKESVLLFEQDNEQKLTKKDRAKILTVKPFLDEIVPTTVVPLEGAINRTMPIIGHTLGGMFALTIYAKKLVEFINS